MAKVYAEFGIEIFDRTLLNQCFDIMKVLGDVEIKETRRKTYIIEYHTKIQEVKEIELIDDIEYKNNKTMFKFKCTVSKGTYIRSLINDTTVAKSILFFSPVLKEL